MTRSSRLLAAGLAVLLLALVVGLYAMTRGGDEPIAIADAGTGDAAAETDVAAEAPAAEALRLPDPVEIPEGLEAVAVTTSYDRAVAALPVPGDRINLYGVFTDLEPAELAEGGDAISSGAARVLAGVEVLAVTGAEPATAGGTVTFVLAVEPDEALKLVHVAGNEALWFSLVPEGAEPVAGDSVTSEDVLG